MSLRLRREARTREQNWNLMEEKSWKCVRYSLREYETRKEDRGVW
jgi:hypothetical protein